MSPNTPRTTSHLQAIDGGRAGEAPQAQRKGNALTKFIGRNYLKIVGVAAATAVGIGVNAVNQSQDQHRAKPEATPAPVAGMSVEELKALPNQTPIMPTQGEGIEDLVKQVDPEALGNAETFENLKVVATENAGHDGLQAGTAIAIPDIHPGTPEIPAEQQPPK